MKLKVKYVGYTPVANPDMHLYFEHGTEAEVPEEIAKELVKSGEFELVEGEVNE